METNEVGFKKGNLVAGGRPLDESTYGLVESHRPNSRVQFPLKKRCVVCGKEADPKLTLEFDGEVYFSDTLDCAITVYLAIEKVKTEREISLEEARGSASRGDSQMGPW